MGHSYVDPPVPATAVLVDLRNFTPSLNAAGQDERGTNRFCFFLAEFYDATLEACRLALSPAEREHPPFSVNSTGDGMLIVFTGTRHFASGMLAAFLLDAGLRRACERAGREGALPPLDFGVGVESGEVSLVHAGVGPTRLVTVIGHCVNVAARVEAMTKIVASARVAIGDGVVERCAGAIYGVTFREMRRREVDAASDEERVAVQVRMEEMNRGLCLTFLDRYVLKGVEQPLPLYRIDGSAARSGVERFERLLRHLVAGDDAHYAEVVAHLAGAG